MLDARLFTALAPAARVRLGDEYLAFVAERDGEPDLGRRTLSRREAWFTELAQGGMPPWEGGAIDPQAFAAWHWADLPLRDSPPLAVWLVAIARCKEWVGWSIDYLLDRGGSQGLGGGGTLRPLHFADLEE